MEQNEQNQFKCTGDCTQCSRIQREYCAAQKGYDNQRLLIALTGKMEEMQAKIAAIQDNEAHVFNPATVPDGDTSGQDTAQQGSGAV